MLVPPKNETKNNIPADARHFLRTKLDSIDFKKEDLRAKIRRKKA